MKSLPDGFDVDLLAPALVAGWDLNPASVDYAPVGFGSYHWYVSTKNGDRFFVTLDDLDHRPWLGTTRDAAFDGLSAALATATALRDGCGLDFVVAPLPAAGGAPVVRVGDRHALAVYPHLPGAAGGFGQRLDPDARDRLVDMLIRLHQATPTPAFARRNVPVPGRRALEATLEQTGGRWAAGPYSEPARRWLADHAGLVHERLGELDRLAATIADSASVVTHGEPHPGNVLDLVGRSFLIDWDTVALAPPERDLVLLGDDAETLAAYAADTGHAPDPAGLALYALAWELNDVAAYVEQLRSPHGDDEDARDALTYLTASFGKVTG